MRNIYTVLWNRSICDVIWLRDSVIVRQREYFWLNSLFISKCIGGSATLPTVLFDCTNLFSDSFKHLLDTSAFFGWYFGPDHFVLLGKCDWTRLVNPLLFDRDIALVSRQRHNKSILVCGRVCFHLVDPILDRLKRLLVGQIIANNGAYRVPIVHVDHRAEAFMATCIPNMHLHLLLGTGWVIRVLNAYYFLEIGTADSDVVHFIKSILAEA